MRLLGNSALCALFLWVIACAGASSSTGEAPSLTDARALLSAMVDLAEAGDFEALCSLHGGDEPRADCMHATTALVDVPSIQAVVLSERILKANPPSTTGGMVLTVCLHLGDETVETEILFLHPRGKNDQTVVAYPHFWEPRKIVQGTNLAAPVSTLGPGATVAECG